MKSFVHSKKLVLFFGGAVKKITLFLLLLPALLQAQMPSCKDLHTGVFYSYPKNTSNRYVSVNDGKWQKENNLSNGDSTLWQIDWKNDCSYTLTYVSGGKKLPRESLSLVKQHKIFIEIEKVTTAYYTYSSYLDKKTTIPITKDTMWLHEKAVVANNELFKPYKTRVIPRKDHFSDTSQYAVLYLYRPGKVTNSLSDFVVYLDDNLIWAANSNSGYLFKILKEGKYRIKSRYQKDEAFVDVYFKYGQIYYVKSIMKWGFYKGKNYKLDMEEVKAEQGAKEFAEVDFR